MSKWTTTSRQNMENQLDEVSKGELEWRPMLDEFYHPFADRLNKAREKMPRQDVVEKVGRTCPRCEDGDLVIKHSRYGKFIGCANYPDCKHTERYLERMGLLCPQCGETSYHGESRPTAQPQRQNLLRLQPLSGFAILPSGGCQETSRNWKSNLPPKSRLSSSRPRNQPRAQILSTTTFHKAIRSTKRHRQARDNAAAHAKYFATH